MFYYIPEQNPHIEKVNHNTITKHQDEFRKKKKTKTKKKPNKIRQKNKHLNWLYKQIPQNTTLQNSQNHMITWIM